MIRRLSAVFAACLAVAIASACSATDPYSTNYSVQSLRFTVFANTGTPEIYPSALSINGISAMRATIASSGTAGFDIVFDLDSLNRIKVIPVKAFAVAPSLSLQTIGLQTVTSKFDSTNTAPLDGYTFDSTKVVTKGQTIFVQTRPSNCVYSLTQTQYSKLIVDTVDFITRRMALRLVANPNCGKRDVTNSFTN